MIMKKFNYQLRVRVLLLSKVIECGLSMKDESGHNNNPGYCTKKNIRRTKRNFDECLRNKFG